MQTAGSVGVFVNLLTPGIVKIATLTDDSGDHANPLGGLSGLSDPFALVHSDHVVDAQQVLAFVHADLESRGLRVSSDRDLFRTTPEEAIRLLQQATGHLESSSETGPDDETDDETVEAEDEIGDDEPRPVSDAPTEMSAQDVLEQALTAYYGLGDAQADKSLALRLFGEAARLGSLAAFEYMGQMYELGDGEWNGVQKAREFYQEGLRRGNLLCYAHLGSSFRDEVHRDTCEMYWSQFFDALQSGRVSKTGGPADVDELVFWYVHECLNSGREPGHLAILRQYKKSLLGHEPVRKWVRRNLADSWWDRVLGAVGL